MWISISICWHFHSYLSELRQTLSIDAINVTEYSLYNQGLKMLLLSIPKKGGFFEICLILRNYCRHKYQVKLLFFTKVKMVFLLIFPLVNNSLFLPGWVRVPKRECRNDFFQSDKLCGVCLPPVWWPMILGEIPDLVGRRGCRCLYYI